MHFKKWNIPELDLFLPFKFESPFIEYSVNGTFFDKKKQEKEEKAEAKSALEKSHNICERCQPKIWYTTGLMSQQLIQLLGVGRVTTQACFSGPELKIGSQRNGSRQKRQKM